MAVKKESKEKTKFQQIPNALLEIPIEDSITETIDSSNDTRNNTLDDDYDDNILYHDEASLFSIQTTKFSTKLRFLVLLAVFLLGIVIGRLSKGTVYIHDTVIDESSCNKVQSTTTVTANSTTVTTVANSSGLSNFQVMNSKSKTVYITTSKTNAPTQTFTMPIKKKSHEVKKKSSSQDTKKEHLKSLLSPITSLELFTNKTSPQYQAFQFISSEYNNNATSTELETISAPNLQQRFIVATFFYSTSIDHFLEHNKHECNWQGIQECNHLNEITKINLNSKNLSKSVPNEICHLPQLQFLSLKENQLTGAIPSCQEERDLALIQEINLNSNHFLGTIPSFMKSLQYLSKLSLSNNYFSGTIPFSLFNLQFLTDISLAHNSFTGSLPLSIIVGNSYLHSFDVSYNSLTGTIPHHAFGDAPMLQILKVNDNHLTGDVTSFVKNLEKVHLLEFQHNPDLYGSILLNQKITTVLGIVVHRSCTNNGDNYVDVSVDCDFVVCPCCTKCFHYDNEGKEEEKIKNTLADDDDGIYLLQNETFDEHFFGRNESHDTMSDDDIF